MSGAAELAKAFPMVEFVHELQKIKDSSSGIDGVRHRVEVHWSRCDAQATLEAPPQLVKDLTFFNLYHAQPMLYANEPGNRTQMREDIRTDWSCPGSRGIISFLQTLVKA